MYRSETAPIIWSFNKLYGRDRSSVGADGATPQGNSQAQVTVQQDNLERGANAPTEGESPVRRPG